MYRTRGARGGSKLNRTLHESPATASLRSATPKEKHSLLFLIFAGVIFSKMERTFFFLGLLAYSPVRGASVYSFNFRSKKVRATCIITAPKST